MTKVGIVVLNYNDYETTKKYIDRIKSYKVLSHIVVVDNCSTDRSFDKLKDEQSNKVSIIKTDDNKGYASGNNFGIEYLNKYYNVDYIIISNPDIIVDEKTIEKLKKDLDSNNDIAVVSPYINQLGEIKRGWRLPTIKDEILLNINHYHKKVEKQLEYDDDKFSGYVDAVSGCFFMIRNDILSLIGNFDESTFLYYEENILAAKLKTIEKKSYVDKNVSITHDLSTSVDKSFDSIKKYKILKDSQKYFVKNYLKATKFQMFVLRLTYYVSLGIAYIVSFIYSLRRKK